jgi:hypothetical protein
MGFVKALKAVAGADCMSADRCLLLVKEPRPTAFPHWEDNLLYYLFAHMSNKKKPSNSLGSRHFYI